MRPYIAFYKHKQIELEAPSSYEAHKLACKLLKVSPRYQHMVSVMLADVYHSTTEI